LFGGGGLRNALHGSATKEAAAAEIKLLFSDLPCANLNQEEAEARAYIAIKLQATLNKALTALARQKPTSDKDAALTFLAEWLLANNPNKPQVVAPEGAASSSSSAAAQRAASEDLSVLLRRQELAQHELQDVMRDGGAARAAAARVAKPGQLANSGAEDVAATKVQAAFRGHKARKQVHAMKSAQPAAGASADAATAGADTSAEQPTEEAAAAAAAEDEAAATEEAAAAAEAEVAAGAVEPAEPVAAAVEAA
jgi:nucleoside-diphosphate kinase